MGVPRFFLWLYKKYKSQKFILSKDGHFKGYWIDPVKKNGKIVKYQFSKSLKIMI